MKNTKKTQGHDKMLRYIEDLIRNKDFQRRLKRLRQLKKHSVMPKGTYYEWSPEEQAKHDYTNNELGSIIDGYELLRKRCKKIVRDRDFIIREGVASDYGLDNDLLNLAIVMADKDSESIESAKDFAEPDMCKLVDIYDDTLNNAINKGDEIIYLRPSRYLRTIAYPTAIVIHPKASQRDVLDFIEKRWPWIEGMLRHSEEDKPLKIRKRKHSQDMLDYIWQYRSLSAARIITKLDNEFPKHGLAYYEISKIIQLEKQKRLKRLT